MTVIEFVCAWCGKDMGEKDGQGQEGISHGICEECQDRWEKELPFPQVAKLELNKEVKHESD